MEFKNKLSGIIILISVSISSYSQKEILRPPTEPAAINTSLRTIFDYDAELVQEFQLSMKRMFYYKGYEKDQKVLEWASSSLSTTLERLKSTTMENGKAFEMVWFIIHIKTYISSYEAILPTKAKILSRRILKIKFWNLSGETTISKK